MIVWPQPGRAVVLSAGRERDAVEFVHCLAVLGHESDVQLALEFTAEPNPEIWLASSPKPTHSSAPPVSAFVTSITVPYPSDASTLV